MDVERGGLRQGLNTVGRPVGGGWWRVVRRRREEPPQPAATPPTQGGLPVKARLPPKKPLTEYSE